MSLSPALFKEFQSPMDHARMMDLLDRLTRDYPFLTVTPFAESLYGKQIPMIRLGEETAPKSVLYVGAHHGMEWLTASLLLAFIAEYCQSYAADEVLFSNNVRRLHKTRLLCVIPMLNPDGVDIQIHGKDVSPIPDRLLAMNGGSEDFSHWQANGRGVDLNHNYDAGFAEYKPLERAAGIFSGGPTRYSGERPESEPEVGTLANYLRFDDSIRMLLSFHTQGEEIYYTSGDVTPPASEEIARQLSKMSGYALSKPEDMASYGGLLDFALQSLALPAFTLECGRGVNPLPATDFFSVYPALREMLFSAPFLV